MGADAFAAAFKAHSFSGRCLDRNSVYVYSEHVCDPLAHIRYERSQFGSLRDQCGIDVQDRVTLFGQYPAGLIKKQE